MKLSKEQIRQHVIGVLNDDNGISEVSYQILLTINNERGEDISDIISAVKCTDGRYYLTKDWIESNGQVSQEANSY